MLHYSMQREIKFRVWDSLEGIWMEDKGFSRISFDTFGRFYPYGTGFSSEECPERFIVQQFTGLEDKYGEEIWEGDILKLHDKRGDKVGDVYYVAGSFLMRGVDSLWFAAKRGICEDHEVIGHIFE